MKNLLWIASLAGGLSLAPLRAQTEPVEPSPAATQEAAPKSQAPARPAEVGVTPDGDAKVVVKTDACMDCLDCHGDEGLTLRKLEQDWADAIVHHDADAIQRIEADEFICTGPSGEVTHRADDLATAKTAALKITDLKIEDTKVSVYGETAVVTGKSTFNGSAYDQTFGGSYRWTDVFVKREGRWQVVASQATPVGPTSAGTAGSQTGE